MEFDEPGWEPDSFDAAPPESAPPPSPSPEPAAPPPRRQQGAKRMYEPPPAGQPDNSTQWAEYEPTTFVPPQDDFAPSPMNAPGPPPGRHYAQYRQPPSWQHASMAGLGEYVTTGSVIANLMSNLLYVAAGAGLGYLFTGSLRSAGGAGLALLSVGQLPQVFRSGGGLRLGIALGAGAAAAWLLWPNISEMKANLSGDDDWDYNENDDDEPDDSEGDEKSDKSVGARPSDDPTEPEQSSPWMKHVA